MAARSTKYHRIREDDERVKLLADVEDTYDIRFSGSPHQKKRKPRHGGYERKLSDDEDNIALVDINAAPNAPPRDQCVETEVQPGDTLASLALKYNLPVSELKRVNNIMAENQFYALKRIKIPVKPSSLLTEMLPSVHEANGEAKLGNGWYVNETTSPILTGGTTSTVPSSPPSDVEHELIPGLGDSSQSASAKPAMPNSTSKTSKKARRFLRNVDKDVARIRGRIEGSDDELDEEEVDLAADEIVNNPANANRDPVIIEAERNNNLNKVDDGFLSSGNSVRNRRACFVFIAVIAVVLIIILIFAHHEFYVVSEHHNFAQEEQSKQHHAGGHGDHHRRSARNFHHHRSRHD